MRRNRRFKTTQTMDPTSAPAATEIDDACPVCGWDGDDPCVDKNGNEMGRPHKARYASD